jgi:hypothetical protein
MIVAWYMMGSAKGGFLGIANILSDDKFSAQKVALER